MELIYENWYDRLLDELRLTTQLRIVSPFVKEQIVRELDGKINWQKLELVTRGSIKDFVSDVSSVEALIFCLEKGAAVYCIKGLHSKVYLFDSRAAIVTSANLTLGGLKHSFECGVLLTETAAIQELASYIDGLKAIPGAQRSLEDCRRWQVEVSEVKRRHPPAPSYPDHGASRAQSDTDKQHFVKFIGKSTTRVPLSTATRDIIDNSLCHYACGFSQNKAPRRFNDGDVVYFARMVRDPANYAIFGRAVVIKYDRQRDRASQAEIQERGWKEEYPLYLRVKHPVFLAGTLDDGIMLFDIIKALGSESFVTTSERSKKGEKNINPYRSLSQQPYVRLTLQAVEWVESRFRRALERVGKVEQAVLDTLPQSNVPL
jgi:hypothetical protein